MKNKKPELILPSDTKVVDPTNEADIIDIRDYVKVDPIEPDSDWLWRLPLGSVFLVAPPPEKDQYGRNVYNPALMEFHVIQKEDNPKAVKLLQNLNQDNLMWVQSKYFSEHFKLHKILFIGTED